ncbi:hypothetical protein GCM10028784_39320 [Myceligenerans cantabricum]
MSDETTGDGLRLDRAVDSIIVGLRHRREVGDLEALRDSIDRLGLLCPLTVTPDGYLLCGWRRLEAVRTLGWKSVPVYVRRASAGLRDVIAEHEENTVREPLPLETAEELYREYKSLEAEQAALRQRATRFHAAPASAGSGDESGVKGGGKRGNLGAADSAGPSDQALHVPGRHGESRAKAAQMVTGSNSYTRFEHAGRIKDARKDPDLPAHIRAMAKTAWDNVTAGNASAQKEWAKISAAITEHEATADQPAEDGSQVDPADLAAVARAALAQPRRRRQAATSDDETVATPSTERSLAEALTAFGEWIDHADPDALAENASTAELARMHHTTERFDHLCTAVHAALHKRHPALRRRKTTGGAQGDAVSGEQSRLW